MAVPARSVRALVAGRLHVGHRFIGAPSPELRADGALSGVIRHVMNPGPGQEFPTRGDGHAGIMRDAGGENPAVERKKEAVRDTRRR